MSSNWPRWIYRSISVSMSALIPVSHRLHSSLSKVDFPLAEAASIHPLHASSYSSTSFVSSKVIVSHLKCLQTKLKNPAEPQALALLPHPPLQDAGKSTHEREEKRPLEGAVQIAIVSRKRSISLCGIPTCCSKPTTTSIWDETQKIGVQGSYFLMFLRDPPRSDSPEVARVTKASQSDLEEFIAIHLTSQTAIARQADSRHRDLPCSTNRSVVRWQFRSHQPFLHPSEILWQEGHTAFYKEADDIAVRDFLDLYRQVYEDLLAVPVTLGVKSENAGGLYTTTLEGVTSTSRRGIQAATSHFLSRNFSKPEMFNIFVEDTVDKSKPYVWRNSWGLSTSAIGVMVMVHGETQGLVLPLLVQANIGNVCDELAQMLRKAGVRAEADLRDGYELNDWEQKGVPVHREIRLDDFAKKRALTVRRDTGVKNPAPLDNIGSTISSILETIQTDTLTTVKQTYREHVKTITEWNDAVPALDAKNFIAIPWCDSEACEDDIKDLIGGSAEPLYEGRSG
ncbi:hypothetical protein BKA70DRAFT_1474851 [Coprinopsis sp. MPI-PUGE-AT-0042]|nr:hypothetical protein BKA70DRAFT_1474851 [Coprinopsis sp. MPI-PUGE-AT-0042]